MKTVASSIVDALGGQEIFHRTFTGYAFDSRGSKLTLRVSPKVKAAHDINRIVFRFVGGWYTVELWRMSAIRAPKRIAEFTRVPERNLKNLVESACSLVLADGTLPGVKLKGWAQ